MEIIKKDKPMPKIIGIYVSDEKFESIWNDLYFERSREPERRRIDRNVRKEWFFKGFLSTDAGFLVRLEMTNSENQNILNLVVIRSKDYRLKVNGTKYWSMNFHMS